MEERKHGRRRNVILLTAFGIALLAIIAYTLYSLTGSSGSKQVKPPKISLLPNTPPPPPPPKEEKKPEPPKERKEVKLEQPDQRQPPAPESEKVMDGPKGDGPSDFKAGNVAREDYSIKSDGGNRFAFYSSLMQKFLQDELARNKTLAGKEYRISVMLWLDPGGRIEKFSLTQTSGNPQTDTLIRNALAEMPPLKAPPENMPRPVGVRISSRS